MRRQVREFERPEPSVVWQTLAITFAGFGFSAALRALTAYLWEDCCKRGKGCC